MRLASALDWIVRVVADRVFMTYYTYPITIEKDDGQYFAYSGDLPSVYGRGDSIEEAKDSMLNGIRLYIEECKKHGREIAVARTVHADRDAVNRNN